MEFLGCPYPIVKTPRGLLATQSSLDQVKSDLLCLLLTNPGERVMLPDYGTPLSTLIFEPNDKTIRETAKEMIAKSIALWEPRVTIDQIEVGVLDESSLNKDDLKQDIEHILFIRIMFFDPQNIKAIQELKLKLPLSEGVQ